jgi:hypothetical protein
MIFLKKFQDVIDQTDLSDISKQTYKYRMNRLTQITNHDMDWVLLHVDETYELIKSFAIQTQKGYINTALACFKYTKDFKKKRNTTYMKWYKLFQEVNAKAEEKYDNMEASARQQEVYVSWPDVIKAREELNKKSESYLLLSLYTMIPPSRADMNYIFIYDHEDPGDKYPNYLHWTDAGMKLVYNEFKSKSKNLQKYEKVLPENLEEVVRQSLLEHPRQFLIVSPRTSKPYAKAASFAKYFDRMLEKIFNKRVTINTLRHSFVNSLDMNKLTPKEKELIAKDLMHSKDTMDKYRLAISAKDSHIGKDQICEVVCSPRDHVHD